MSAASVGTDSARLRITEIFYSLQGEAKTVGWPTVFIRLTGCPLRCVYCDTEYAFQGGSLMSQHDILKEVSSYDSLYVTVTGGEPLGQPNCQSLLSALCDQGYKVSLETSGALSIAEVDDRVSIVMDIKTPGSGEMEKNRSENMALLREKDELKFVLMDRQDYEWSRDFIQRNKLDSRCDVLFSPVHNRLDATTLADWVLQDRLAVRLQLPLHKILWGDAPGH